jgi:hypothetical protein
LKDTNTEITEKDFYFAYGMSKMTISKEALEYKRYSVIQLVELLEMIARVAEARFIETSGLTLVRKIELTLDVLLTLINVQRNPVKGQDDYLTCSDDEY